MKLHRLIFAVAIMLVVSASAASAGILFPDPAGGWTYTYDGSLDAYGNAGAVTDNAGAGKNALDGFWTHDNGSDSWADTTNGAGLGDRLGPGVGLAGGVQSLTEGSNVFLRLMDGITTNTNGFDNRRNYFMRDLASLPGFTPNFLDTGVTISFRSRLTPDAALEGTLTAANKGSTVGSDGKGMFGIRQASPSSIVTFALHRGSGETDGATAAPNPVLTTPGLAMPKNVADAPNANVGGNVSTGFPQQQLNIDTNDWHEFWITIQANDATVGNGTHTVNVYVDGNLTPQTFNITAGTGNDTGALPVGSTTNYLAMGHNFTGTQASYDADFYSVAFRAIPPIPEPGTIALACIGALGLALAFKRRLRK